jgi:hypothetical protein
MFNAANSRQLKALSLQQLPKLHGFYYNTFSSVISRAAYNSCCRCFSIFFTLSVTIHGYKSAIPAAAIITAEKTCILTKSSPFTSAPAQGLPISTPAPTHTSIIPNRVPKTDKSGEIGLRVTQTGLQVIKTPLVKPYKTVNAMKPPRLCTPIQPNNTAELANVLATRTGKGPILSAISEGSVRPKALLPLSTANM